MAQKNIVTIGFELNNDNVNHCEFNSDSSLLDFDIILFKPDISEFISYSDMFEGKPCLTDHKSFQLKDRIQHWRREILESVDCGKTVVVFLSELTQVFIATGEKSFSGTGKNRQTTRHVGAYDNYKIIPAELDVVKTQGHEIKIAPKSSELIASYWKEFSEESCYKVTLGDKVPPCLLTKNGDKAVGSIVRHKSSNGTLILLPYMDFYPDNFLDHEGDWTNESGKFASRLIKSIVTLEKAIKNTGEVTAEPEWCKSKDYKLKSEDALDTQLLKVESELEQIQLKKESIINKLKDSGTLRNLLFEKGKPLEFSILDALKQLGFSVSQFENSESEFDAVFESKEGRLIGEAEGKDNKAINIDKLRQLALNIHEDLEREEVESPAKPVLFGNAYRLQELSERNDPFTTKCHTASKTNSTALLFTPDLFMVAKYLSDNKDLRFATKCRKTILSSIGRVNFPEIPKEKATSKTLKNES
ncbi:hypothetical protein [Vibrio sp. VB16]|uniref:hypothetical protein n=1 Tax=Vibrio sp. VB16 TaxID=2785746 RepID=UPI00189D73B6|nr:hypothetical protein [Vibrio sp. VB16]UGA55309.1 hypothetical protein IUZ65_002855 [Vibrio sp. VB16]